MTDVKENAIDAMNEALAGLITKAVSGAEAAGEFLVGEIPEVVNQLIVFNLSWHVFVCLLCLLIAYASYKSANYPFKDVKKLGADSFWGNTEGEPDEHCIAPVLFGGAAMLVSFLFFINYAKDTFMLWLAPKVWLIEYGATLVK